MSQNQQGVTTKPQSKSRWYILQAYSGSEDRVVEQIGIDAEKKSLQAFISQIVVPSEKTTEVRRGAKVEVDRKFFPGYILINAVMTDDLWHTIINVPRVTGFLGSNNRSRPMPISNAEAKRILTQVEEGFKNTVVRVNFDIGETIKVKEGPLKTFTGDITHIDSDTNKLKVNISIFGRETEVELGFDEVEKL